MKAVNPEGRGSLKEYQGQTTHVGEDLLGLAKKLGNISEACRRFGVDRSTYYRLLHRAETPDLDSHHAGLHNLHQKVVELCLEYPDWGCDKLSLYLSLTGTRISSPTVQKILIRHGLGRYSQRATANKLDFLKSDTSVS